MFSQELTCEIKKEPSRLNLDMNGGEILRALFKEDRRSRAVFYTLGANLPLIDPFMNYGMHAFGHLAQWIDDLNLYENKLWDLYEKLCKKDGILTIAVLRGGQLGATDREALHRALDKGSDADFDLDKIARYVQEKIPGFWQMVSLTPPYRGPRPSYPTDEL